VPAEVVDAGTGMGMTPSQVMWRVRVPLAIPVLFSGERTAAVQTIGNSTLGAFVAAFTLGTIIFGGLSQQAMDLTMLGSVALVILALLADGVLRVLQRLVAPRRRSRVGGAP
jgi:osmoprotectant transport system permease protein